MKLYLMRHGEAVKKDVYTDRPLSERGREDTKKTAKFLKAGGIKPNAIWHSAKLRAKETAQILAAELKPVGGLVEKDGLLPEDPVEKIFAEVLSLKDTVMLVGHIPFLQKLASLALLDSGAFEVIKFNLGGVACLEQAADGKWLLLFELIPEIVT